MPTTSEPPARACPVLHYDHRAVPPAERFEVWKDLRAKGPIAWSECYDGFWVVSGHAEVSAVMRDAATFSSAKTEDGKGGQSIPPFPWVRNVPGEYDGEEHERLRAVLIPPLSPKLIEERRPIVAGIVSDIFDKLDGRETVDATREIAVLVPAHSMFTFMGMPREDAETLGLMVHSVNGARGGDDVQAILRAIEQRMLDEAAARRANPTDDIISLFANYRHESRHLGDDELLSVMVTALLFGGLVTAAETLANGMIYLDRRRDARAELIAHPERMANFVHDLVRYVSPATVVARTVTRDTTLGGQTLRPGERILCNIGAANHDPAAFVDPERVDAGSWRNNQLGFGVGPHFCPGAPLARLEIEVALLELLRRMPDYAIDNLDHLTRGLADPAGGWRPLMLRPNG
jgi:cytochrome P450